MAKETLELISAKSGVTGIAIYSWLCFYADSTTQRCYPSITTLAKQCKVSRRTVIRGIQLLEDIKVIGIEHSKGEKNIYWLLDINNKNSKKTTSISAVTSDSRDTRVVTPGIRGVVTPGIHKQYIKQQESFNNNNKKYKQVTDFYLNEKLGRIATKDMIKEVLKDLPQNIWWKVNSFLRKQYPGDNGSVFAEVERELIKEMRNSNEQMERLTSSIIK